MVSKEIVLDLAFKNHRVCPQPSQWSVLFKLLSKKAKEMGVEEPSIPLILTGWHYSTDFAKADRMFQHIEWAAENDYLDAIYDWLSDLNEEEWYHDAPFPGGENTIESGPGFLVLRKLYENNST